MSSLAWLPAALPVLGAAIKASTSLVNRSAEHRLERDLRRHSKLLTELPPEADKTPLLRLVNAEAQAIYAQSEKRLHRRLDVGNLAAVIVVLLVSTGVVWFLWGLDLQRHWLEVVLRIVAVVVGLLGFTAALVGGLANLWIDETPSAPASKQQSEGTVIAKPRVDADTSSVARLPTPSSEQAAPETAAPS